jgi:Right handed beta helix region
METKERLLAALVSKARFLLLGGLLSFIAATAVHAQSIVDCSGTNLNAYPSINAAMAASGPGAFILVSGVCNENVSIFLGNGFWLGAYYGQTATINGNVSISNSTSVYLYGLTVSNPYNDGINVNSSRSVMLDTCNLSGSAGVGLNVGAGSDVNIMTSGTFDNNGRGGISVFGDAVVSANGWGGPIDISNNGGPGLWSSQGSFNTLGHTTIANNTFAPGSNSGFGIDMRGAGRAQFGTVYGPNYVTGNQSGGASLQENSEISFWSFGASNFIQNNGPLGVSAGLGSQVTVYNNAVISGHTSAGVDLYGNSQAYLFGPNTLQGNGSSSDARSAAIRVDGNSEAFVRGGAVTGNAGPAMLVLVNSSADFSGVSFSGNTNVIACDSSSTMVSDLTQPNSTPPAGVLCRTPHGLGGHPITKTQPVAPDVSALKAIHDKYAKMAVKH